MSSETMRMFSKKVLVVSGDGSEARRTYGRLLAAHHLIFAADPLETLARLSEHRDVEVILIDLGASPRHGVDVLHRLDGHPVAARLPVVVAGADDSLLHTVRTARSGRASAYVTKPFRGEDLLRALHHATEARS
jgi:CheY-like chemotaxis protein